MTQTTATPPTPSQPALTPATKLHYRRPGALSAPKLDIPTAVRYREAKYQAAAWTMLLVGAAALLIAPALIASIVDGGENRFNVHSPVSWWSLFAISFCVITPLLFWCERRTRGRWYEDEMRGQGASIAGATRWSSRGEYELATTAATWAAIFEIALWGPRMVMSAMERFRTHVPPAVVTEAAALINFLRHFEGGVATSELPAVRPQPVINYLLTRDWVGISKKCDRIWLLTDARKTLGFPTT